MGNSERISITIKHIGVYKHVDILEPLSSKNDSIHHIVLKHLSLILSNIIGVCEFEGSVYSWGKGYYRGVDGG